MIAILATTTLDKNLSWFALGTVSTSHSLNTVTLTGDLIALIAQATMRVAIARQAILFRVSVVSVVASVAFYASVPLFTLAYELIFDVYATSCSMIVFSAWTLASFAFLSR